jgi:hypothetical protein
MYEGAWRRAHDRRTSRLALSLNMRFFRSRPVGIAIVALFMILFGLAEVTTPSRIISSASKPRRSAGVLVLTMKRRAAALAVLLLATVIVGRVVLVASGLYPTDSAENTLAIIAGTTIVAVFAVYIALKWRSFSA